MERAEQRETKHVRCVKTTSRSSSVRCRYSLNNDWKKYREERWNESFLSWTWNERNDKFPITVPRFLELLNYYMQNDCAQRQRAEPVYEGVRTTSVLKNVRTSKRRSVTIEMLQYLHIALYTSSLFGISQSSNSLSLHNSCLCVVQGLSTP